MVTTDLLMLNLATGSLPRAAVTVTRGDSFGMPLFITGALHFALPLRGLATAFGKCRAGRESGDCRPGTLQSPGR